MIAALLIVVLAQSQAPQRDTRPAVPVAATGTISGIVTSADAQPRPLRRTRVVLVGSAARPRSFVTGDDGTFRFDRVPAGAFAIMASKEGYIATDPTGADPPHSGARLTLRANQSLNVRLALPRGAVITGTVTDLDSLPAQGVNVTVLARRFVGSIAGDYAYAFAGTPSSARTDDRGVYRIYGLPAGDYLVAAQPAFETDSLFGGPARVVQAMGRGGARSKPLLLSQVFHPGTADVGQASRISVRTGEERAGIDIQLAYVPLATVSGSINLASGFSPARVVLWRLDEQARPQTAPVTTADAQGRFEFASVAPGQYRVSARALLAGETATGRAGGAANVQYANAEVTVNGEDVEIALATQAALSISGRITFDTQGPAPAQLPASLRVPVPLASRGGWPFPPLVIDGTRFRLDGIVPGTYRMIGTMQGIRAPIGRWWLTSIAAAGRELLDVPITLQQPIDDAVATLSDRASEVSGIVTDAQGAPAGGVIVVAFATNRDSWFVNSRRVVGVRSGPAGEYMIRNLPPGEYRIAAKRDLRQNEWFDPAVLEGLMPASTSVTITGVEKLAINLEHR